MAPASVGEMKRPGEPIGEGEGGATATATFPSGAATDPDVALMLRLQAGDQAAFQDLFQKFSPRVLQYARRLVGSEARAEEVTQDVFVQVFRFRHRYRPESRFSTWLFTIATNLCLNELRRPERHLRVDLWKPRDDDDRREGPQLADPMAITPEEGASGRELARQLETAVGALPPKQRAALLLSRVDGLAYRDVAEALGCTEGAVKALLFRATQSLKKTLREYL
jgi:RNA polymerase sigma-70 factor (ECF subfamily)